MRTWFALLFVALAVTAAPARVQADEGDDTDININEIVDQLLELAHTEIINLGLDQIVLPDITEKFKKKVGPISISGRFEARDGWAKSLASLDRSGEATLAEDGDRLVVEVPLSLSDLQIGYGYKAKLGKLGPGGKLTATVNSNTVTLRASLLISDDACSLGVDSLVLTDLGKINVHVTGLGKLNFLYSKIVTWVTAKLHDKIEGAVQKGLRDAINKAGLKLDCNSLFGM
ncbi:hypothetical protein FOCC_FOCC007651 [Frankliniella occidentalis]|uniref:Uncharacterized protein LOC113210130 isoform X2 n=1 Tax=Frankliniella occidentalis TaxID=133901 RepID=A0A6J1SSA4_FRAOC|nr:uncharacterized protein LOC113210130 isoform X2 [Frankliniella occidentalis]KAE8745650.1 hypothetical protein FOCC_FOCC007651 [Frankliniella occidentalis]